MMKHQSGPQHILRLIELSVVTVISRLLQGRIHTRDRTSFAVIALHNHVSAVFERAQLHTELLFLHRQDRSFLRTLFRRAAVADHQRAENHDRQKNNQRRKLFRQRYLRFQHRESSPRLSRWQAQ